MGNLFIFGNGFDLAHGLPTRYEDFKDFLIKNYLTTRNYNRKIELDEIYEEDLDEFSAELLISVMEDATDDEWSDFEDALGRIDFNKKIPDRKNKYDEKGEHNDDNVAEYLLYSDMICSAFTQCVNNWQFLFSRWIKSIQKMLESGNCFSYTILEELYSNPLNKFITFNYTKTLQEIYGIRKVTHIHNRKGQKLIFGHGKENTYFNNYNFSFESFGSSTIDDMMSSLKKDTDTQMKKYKDFFKYLDKNIDKVYSFGFSYCKVDSVYIKEIIKRISDDAIWYFTEFEANDKEGIRIKKIRLRNYGFRGSFDTYKI